MNGDPHHLERFLEAQQDCYTRVLKELAAGEKSSHWMWFIFPQLGGLGLSATSRRFGLTGLAEALGKYYGGEPDPRTLELLAKA